ncbi:uncharacterized protein EDB91DRAFT_1144047 [Suillus paluster]|uniref:uncharacterized protein n=1 Tax=Suillus paluster TaxID=48578 RepID=UPI001B874528|nr:uncharacterized protein EDB91DRAFT_1144047 [Suillus paluster]KAG1735753.1 hypothetical protein EDB91DRAFT_1144047 [Suillus paluster]
MADSLHIPCPLHISGVFVDFIKSGKNVEFAEVRIGKLHSQIERNAEKTLRQTFSPPMILSLADSFSLHLRCKTLFGMKTEHQDVDFDVEDIFRVSGTRTEPERQEYIIFHKKIKILVELSEQAEQPSDDGLALQPTTDEIIRICPRFRILVIGKTGVGKSSLINNAFGVQNAIASHDMPGEANIDTEFVSHQNDRFVLHDSKGFEPGGGGNVNIVQDFINRRRNMPALKDQLHAVCVELP